MPPRPRYRQGRIVWSWLHAISGRRERHPAAIISSDRDIVQPEKFDPRKDIQAVNRVAVVGISTKYRKYPPSIALPYSKDSQGHPVTKLTEDCGACIGWYDWVVLEDDVIHCGGDVPPAEMDRIMAEIAKDLKKKLSGQASQASRELTDINRLLSQLLGES